MTVTRRTLVVALALTPGIGGRTVTRVMTRNDLLGRSFDEFLALSAEALKEEYRFSETAAENWYGQTAQRIEDAETLLKKLDAYDIHIISAADANYPRRIEAMDPDPPGVLFLYGNSKLIDADTFCVLSSRKTSEEGLRTIDSLTEEMVLAGKVLVSGHDTPEYQRSAIVPLRWGAPRILVLDQGFFEVFGENLDEEPFRAARLWRYKFDPKTDLAVTWVNPEKSYHPNANKLRDRLVASLSHSIQIATANKGGNMEHLAKQGLKAGRSVWVTELAESYRELCNLGAKPLTPAQPR